MRLAAAKRRSRYLKNMTLSILKWLIALPLLIYAGLLALLFLFQERLIFPSTPLAEDYTFHFDLPFKEVYVPVDGATLHGLHFVQPEPRGLIFFLHGNAGNLKEWTVGAEFYQQVNSSEFKV